MGLDEAEASTIMHAQVNQSGEACMVDQERWAEIRRLFHEERVSISEIGRRLDMDRKTVRRSLRQATWRPYHRAAVAETLLTAHADFVRDRAPQVGYSARILYQELRARRSVPADAMSRFSGSAAATMVPLQPLDTAAGPGGPPDIRRVAETLAGLDLVITADNWIAHLAGTMGVPTALLLDTAADWRWLDLRADTAWYPSMRLYRQDRPGDWTYAIGALAAELPRLLRAA